MTGTIIVGISLYFLGSQPLLLVCCNCIFRWTYNTWVHPHFLVFRVNQSLVFCVVFCRSLFDLLTFFSIWLLITTLMVLVWFMVFNATINNISIMLWRSVLLVEYIYIYIPRENHRPAANHWQTLSHNVVSSTPLITYNFSIYIFFFKQLEMGLPQKHVLSLLSQI